MELLNLQQHEFLLVTFMSSDLSLSDNSNTRDTGLYETPLSCAAVPLQPPELLITRLLNQFPPAAGLWEERIELRVIFKPQQTGSNNFE